MRNIRSMNRIKERKNELLHKHYNGTITYVIIYDRSSMKI